MKTSWRWHILFGGQSLFFGLWALFLSAYIELVSISLAEHLKGSPSPVVFEVLKRISPNSLGYQLALSFLVALIGYISMSLAAKQIGVTRVTPASGTVLVILLVDTLLLVSIFASVGTAGSLIHHCLHG